MLVGIGLVLATIGVVLYFRARRLPDEVPEEASPTATERLGRRREQETSEV